MSSGLGLVGTVSVATTSNGGPSLEGLVERAVAKMQVHAGDPDMLRVILLFYMREAVRVHDAYGS